MLHTTLSFKVFVGGCVAWQLRACVGRRDLPTALEQMPSCDSPRRTSNIDHRNPNQNIPPAHPANGQPLKSSLTSSCNKKGPPIKKCDDFEVGAEHTERPSETAPGTFLNTPFFDKKLFGSRPKNSRSTRGDLPGTALDTSEDQFSSFSIDLQLLQVDESLMDSDGG